MRPPPVFAAGILAALPLLSPPAPSAQERPLYQQQRFQTAKQTLWRLRKELDPRLHELSELQERYKGPGGLERTARRREMLLQEIGPRIKAFQQAEMELNMLRESLGDDLNPKRAQNFLEFSMDVRNYREKVVRHAREDDEMFRDALEYAKRPRLHPEPPLERIAPPDGFLLDKRPLPNAPHIEPKKGGPIIGLVMLLLIVVLTAALIYQTRRIQTTRIPQMMTPPGTAAVLPVPGAGQAPMVSAPAGPLRQAPAALEGPEAQTPAFRTGDLLDGNYKIERELGRGGMGIVYEATDIALNRKVAIKRMLGEISTQKDELELFLSEARLSAALKHPNLVEIYSILRQSGQVYLVFEHVDGQPLNRYLEGRRRLSLKSAKQTVRQVAAALDYAHKKKIIHRDLKPSNIMVSSEGVAKVMDFGIAHQAKMTVAKLTNVNPWGTPAYMAPEQELGQVSRESDLFALGVCFYEIITGKIPFTGPNFLAQKQQALFAPPTRVTPVLPRETDMILARVLDPDPKKRYRSAAEFAAAVDSLPNETAPA